MGWFLRIFGRYKYFLLLTLQFYQYAEIYDNFKVISIKTFILS